VISGDVRRKHFVVYALKFVTGIDGDVVPFLICESGICGVEQSVDSRQAKIDQTWVGSCMPEVDEFRLPGWVRHGS